MKSKWELKRILSIVISLLLFIQTFLIITQVITRDVAMRPLLWTEEVSRYLMIWMVYLGGGVVLSSREHISIDVLVCRLNKKLRFWLVLTSDVILLIYLLFVEALAIKMITLPGIQMQETPALNIPIIYFYLSLPVGTVIMIIVQTSMILHSLKQIRFCLSETDN